MMILIRNGFTLIELSIVIVIIGLIAAGILVGTDLINAARIRAQISQIENMNSAVNTFRLKYNGLPGDLASHKAAAFGMTPRSGAARRGDGNEKLQSCVSANRSTTNFGCEIAMFWNDLGYAGLIEGTYIFNVDDFAGTSGLTVPSDRLAAYFPKAKFGGNNYVAIYSDDLRGQNPVMAVDCPGPFCFSINSMRSTITLGQYDIRQGSFSALQAFAIDNKMDDGIPLNGRVQASYISDLAGNNRVVGDIGQTTTGESCFDVSTIAGISGYLDSNADLVRYGLKGDSANKFYCTISYSYQ